MIRPTMSHAVNKDELHRLMSDYATHLEQQLAKANERISELEKERDYSQRMYNSLLGDLSAGYGELSISECEKHLNKFAIEKKIEALKEQLKRKSFKSVHDLIEIVIDSYENQLRKEQEQ